MWQESLFAQLDAVVTKDGSSSVPVEVENSIGMKMVLIPPGEFMMGSSEAEQARFLDAAQRLPDLAPDALAGLNVEVPADRLAAGETKGIF